jgi:hypothetical protein
MPNYGALETSPRDELGYYQREKTTCFKCQRIFLAIWAILFVLLGVAILITVAFFDLFFISLWPNLFYSIIGFAVGLLAAGVTGSLAIHTRSFAAFWLFAFFTVCLLGSGITLLVFNFVESSNNALPQIEDQWAKGIQEGGRLQNKLCDVQSELDCRGWNRPCGGFQSEFNPPQQNAGHRGQHVRRRAQEWSNEEESEPNDLPNSGSVFSPQAANLRHRLPSWLLELVGNETNTTNVTTAAPTMSTTSPETTTFSPITTIAPTEGRLCPVCASQPTSSEECIVKVQRTVDRIVPAVATITIAVLLIDLVMLGWSLMIRRSSGRRKAEGEWSDATLSPSRYL